jgi:hypothetical protein
VAPRSTISARSATTAGRFSLKSCSLDIDGDNLVTATVALGIAGSEMIGGITSIAPTAKRKTWPVIRDYLTTQRATAIT